MAEWNENSPAGTDPLYMIDNEIRGVKTYLEDILSAEHVFPGEYGSTAGKHTPGKFKAVQVVDDASDLDLNPNGLGYVRNKSLFSNNGTINFVLCGRAGRNFPPGTKCVFKADTAPTGWHVVAGYDTDYALYATQGSSVSQPEGGTVKSSTWAVGGWSATGEHTHTIASSSLAHSHTIKVGCNISGYNFNLVAYLCSSGTMVGDYWDVGGSTGTYRLKTYRTRVSSSSLDSYNGTPSGYDDFRPAYVTLLLCERD